jgi:uncharacterized protein (TIGR02145 family)
MRKGILLFLFYCLSISFVFPEGTKQILLVDGGHGKVQVMPSFSNFAWYTAGGVSAPVDYRLYIHVQNLGEVIYFGFGDCLDNNGSLFSIPVSYRIKDPLGNIVGGLGIVPTAGIGYIGTYAEAVAGPAAIAGAGGYPALSYTPLMTGDYFIEFNFNNSFGNPDRCKFKYFDITVGSPANTALDGRVWSYAWQFTADDNGITNDFQGTLFIYTADSVVTSVFCNGMAPYVFTIACNQFGCFNTGNFANDRRSVSGKHIITQYKIFLNNPDSLIYPTGILGQIVPPVTATANCDGSAVIHLTVNKAGNADVWLDINPAPGVQAQDVVLSGAVNFGLNNFSWNGLNGLGVPVPNGTTFNIKITYINGLTNLPIYDIDDHPNGFIIDLHRPPGPVPGVYWDDNLVGGTQNIINGCIYSLPSTGCHSVPYSIGNNNTINTWWNAVVDTSTAPILYLEKRAPQPLGGIIGLASLCPGTNNVMYYVTPDPNSETYQWSYSGTGATINGNGNDTVYIDFSGIATSGTLSVVGVNSNCGPGLTPSNKPITMLPFPNVTFTAFGPVCIDDAAFVISGGSPVGGTYTIGGLPVVNFDPAVYGVGTFIVTYTYSDPFTGCTKAINQTLTVYPLPVVTMGPLAAVCTNIPPFLLTQGSPLGGIYSGPGVTGGNTFNPATAGPGNHNIVYSYTDGNTCSNSDTTVITVYAVTLAVLAPFAPVCENIPPFPLVNGSPAGGVYTGPGVVGGIFDPAAAGVGTHNIIYTFTNINGCIDADMQTITVLPIPGVPGAIAGPASICQGTLTSNFTTTPIANAVSYSWTLVPPGAGTIAGATTSMTVTWTPGFTGAVQVFVTGVNGCGNGPVSNAHNISVLPRPVVTWTTCNDTVTLNTAKPIILKGGLPLAGMYSGAGVNSVTGIFYPNLAGMGVFTLQYAYTNSYGCAANATKVMRVQVPAPFICGNNYRDIRDNKLYPTILVGAQCWMAANLNYGRNIPFAGHQRDNCIVEKYCYNDNAANCSTRGGLYQWDEIMAYVTAPTSQGLCPPSWHIPTEAEWTLLFSNYINNGFAAAALKYTGYSGFNANLYGVGHMNRVMNWDNFATMFWTSDSHGPYKAWAHGMNSFDPSVSLYPSFRNNAFSVRCVKD